MEWLVIALAALACPVGMGVMMWFMHRRMGGMQMGSIAKEGEGLSIEERLAYLEAEKQALEREIDEARQTGSFQDATMTLPTAFGKEESR